MSVTTQAPPKKNPTFTYTVRTSNGATQTGTATYSSKEALIAKLMASPQNESVLSVRESGVTKVGSKARAKTKSLVAMCRQLDLCLSVGMDERAAIDMVRTDSETMDPVLAYGLLQVSKDMGEGIDMPEAMAKHPYIFPPLMVSTLKAGHDAGEIKAGAAQAANDIEAEDVLRSKIKKALTYPIVILSLSGAIFIFMMMYVVPQFGAMYEDLSGGKTELPALTQAVMGLSASMTWGVPLTAVLAVAGTFWYRQNSREEYVRAFIDPMKLKLPIFGELFRKIALIRFCRVYASLLDNGLHPTDALTITAASVGNIQMEKAILASRDAGLKGEDPIAPLATESMFPKMLLKFLAIGETSGKNAPSLQAAGRMYDRDVEEMTNNMESLIQPFFLVFIGVLVGIVALAVYMPYFSLGDAVSPY
jgi:type IV pilus assembly protein PilC